MSESLQDNISGGLSISSNLMDLCWPNRPEPGAFKRWHFDALSDDGREALVITFHDNFALSPRYFSLQKAANGNSSSGATKIPAVSLTYSIDGNVIMRTVNEFSNDEFAASEDRAMCSIGKSSFRVDTASYGSGFILHLDLLTARKRRIEAELEWLLIESDLLPNGDECGASALKWNLAAPRSDVSGRISLMDQHDRSSRIVHFRGTGYHDQVSSSRSIDSTIGSRFWGRVHFSDSTAVFDHHETVGDICSKLFLIRDGNIHERDVPGLKSSFSRNRYGLKLPRRISFLSGDNIRLRIKPLSVVPSGPFASTILAEMTLMLRDGKPRKAFGIAEMIRPALMRSRLFRWLAEARIGKNGKGPMF